MKEFFQFDDSPEAVQWLNKIMAHLVLKRFSHNKVICHYGETAKSMYFIEAGKAVVLGEDKKAINVALEAGQYFGEYAALTGNRRLATIKARGDVTVYELDSSILLNLMRNNLTLFGYFLKRVYSQNTNTYQQLQSKLASRRKIWGINLFRNIKIGTKIMAVILFVSLLTMIIISGITYTHTLHLTQFIIIFAVITALVTALSFVLSLTIIRPLEELVVNVSRVGSGDLETRIPAEGKDEITDLANAFNRMIFDLKEYIKNLARVTTEKERINSELSVAADIQNDMLPHITSKFKSSEWVGLFARMEPAQQVGGDFYDFFYLDPDESRLAFVIADVSGKGIPAAMFMVIAKTLLKTHLLRLDPAAVLEQVNNLLCEDNSRSMFVTVFVCSLDIKTGMLSYANGGHNRPLIALSGGDYQFMELKKGLPLGVIEGCRYKLCALQLHPGDKLYLYTDGVNEAMNPQGKELGNEAFLAAANKYRNLPPEQFDEAIRKVITEFANGAEQSDDITTMAIMYVKQRLTIE